MAPMVYIRAGQSGRACQHATDGHLIFCAQRFPADSTRSVAAADSMQARVLNAIGQRVEPTHSVCLGESHLLYFREVTDEPTLPFKAQIIFQDAHLVVADKPPLHR
jgi:tRNA pseudouridine32 synthase/23S rRNA pseudouridine746 synthase